MKNFLLGLITGALATYAAVKLSDEETREELSLKLNEYKQKAREAFEKGKACGKEQLNQASNLAKEQYDKGVKNVSEATANVAGKLIDVLENVEEKAQSKL